MAGDEPYRSLSDEDLDAKIAELQQALGKSASSTRPAELSRVVTPSSNGNTAGGNGAGAMPDDEDPDEVML